MKFSEFILTGATLPSYQTPGSAGADIYFTQANRWIGRNSTVKIDTGLYIKDYIKRDVEVELQVRGRSSLTSEGVIVVIGTIDSDYRGKLMLVFHNISDENYLLCKGQRIAQLVCCPVARIPYLEVKDTPREGGFGSTNKDTTTFFQGGKL